MNGDELLTEVLAAATAAFGHPVDADDNFFAQGGDSLVLVELVVTLERRLALSAGERAPAVIDEAVIGAATFAELASELERQTSAPRPAQ